MESEEGGLGAFRSVALSQLQPGAMAHVSRMNASPRPMPEEDPEPNWWKEGAKEGGHKNKVRISTLLCEHDKGDE